MNKRVTTLTSLDAQLTPPGDKSIAHRAVILNSFAEGKARITHFCGGDDCLSTIRCVRAMGARISRSPIRPDTIDVFGVGPAGFQEPDNVLNAGNSGTTTRLLSGLLCGQPFLSVMTGDASLRSRPMGRVIKPLRLMGADVVGRKGGTCAPIVIKGGGIHGVDYALPEPSAQVKSALILAGLFADGNTCIEEPAPTRDHTERMLQYMGAPIKRHGSIVTVSRPPRALRAVSIDVPGDISAAAYWLVAGVIHPDARVVIRDCGVNPTRTGIIDILRGMGARVTLTIKEVGGPEPVADVIVESASLKGILLEGDVIVRAIDEVPILAVAACFASGKTVIRSAQELRVKETDRITQTVRELSRMGARIEELPDGMIIEGVGKLNGAEVDSHGDHRLAMSLAIAGLVAAGTTVIKGAEAASISYPEFWEHLDTVIAGRRLK
ncbi:MAG: 3-phosphoshikimate 1-carboxyvinyltransferase [Dehalococcoidia bacterium]|nr:3-phosphoshikimate 1-carboxyvinyltransferase [Dehalococcoidia bacterium]